MSYKKKKEFVFVAMVCDKPKNRLASDTTFDVEFIKPLQKVENERCGKRK